MPRKRKLSGVKERCRICLIDDGCMSNLFEEPLHSKIKDLIHCTSIDIKDEANLPRVICHVCLYKLDLWNEFKEQFIQSQEMLMDQLEIMGYSENVHKKVQGTVQDASDNNASDNSKKRKCKVPMPSLVPLVFVNKDPVKNQIGLQETCLSEDEPPSSKDSIRNTQEDSMNNYHDGEEKKDENTIQIKPCLTPIKMKTFYGKRGRTVDKRRASTKRWVARKKALLAATGEIVSETDSANSDTQLSPVQKARAKCNTDKEIMRQKRLARELKSLGANLFEKYAVGRESDNFGCADSDSDSRKTRSQKILNSDDLPQTNKNASHSSVSNAKETKANIMFPELDAKGRKNSVPEKHPVENETQVIDMKNTNVNFIPHSVKSELQIGNATYIVTSTLDLSEPNCLNKTTSSTSHKEQKNGVLEQNTQEKNTDIIDAVQLRRINPVSNESNQKAIERCLNIEVEGTELEALKRVQIEIANFVEKEMKQRLLETSTSSVKERKSDRISRKSYQTLNQQLKCIVETTVKKNMECSIINTRSHDVTNMQKPKTVSPIDGKPVTRSEKFQPKVVLKRLDIEKESRHYKINNIHVMDQDSTKVQVEGRCNIVPRGRQSHPHPKYNDYVIATVDFGSNISENETDPELSKPRLNTKTLKKEVNAAKEPINTTDHNDCVKIESSARNNLNSFSKTDAKQVEKHVEKHICGVCGKCFDNRNEVAIHVRTHKAETSVARHNKHKMMRCKRCHEIVEARFVKAHVCKQVHKCYVCNSTFRTEKLLIRHLDSHDHSEFNIENITKVQLKKPGTIIHSAKSDTSLKSDNCLLSSTSTTDVAPHSSKLTECNSEKLKYTKSGIADNSKDNVILKDTYTCFVCDKIFTDEDILKDHLQKHCDDISESEQNKEQYQCAICGDSMESEDALEAHVEKHLFDEEDDNPNLISIGSENDKPNSNTNHCLQCAEIFDSEMLLEMHMQAHEEEAAIAEWEKQGMKSYQFECMICDEPFHTEEELLEHLDVHNGNAHVCQLCEKPFPTLEDLQKHVATH